MKPAERDDLLIRLDEKTNNIYKLTEKQEQHLATLNEKVTKNQLDISKNVSRIAMLDDSVREGVPVRLSRKQVTTGGVGIVSLLSLVLVTVGKVLGWW